MGRNRPSTSTRKKGKHSKNSPGRKQPSSPHTPDLHSDNSNISNISDSNNNTKSLALNRAKREIRSKYADSEFETEMDNIFHTDSESEECSETIDKFTSDGSDIQSSSSRRSKQLEYDSTDSASPRRPNHKQRLTLASVVKKVKNKKDKRKPTVTIHSDDSESPMRRTPHTRRHHRRPRHSPSVSPRGRSCTPNRERRRHRRSSSSSSADRVRQRRRKRVRFSKSDRQARKSKSGDHFAPTKPADQLSSSSDDELFDEDAVSATLHKVLKKKEHSHRGIASKFLIG